MNLEQRQTLWLCPRHGWFVCAPAPQGRCHRCQAFCEGPYVYELTVATLPGAEPLSVRALLRLVAEADADEFDLGILRQRSGTWLVTAFQDRGMLRAEEPHLDHAALDVLRQVTAERVEA